MYQWVKYEVIDRVAVIALNNPTKMNAISGDVVDELHTVLDEIEADKSIRAMLLWGGNEKYFSAGGDIGFMLKISVAEAYALSCKSNKLYSRMESLSIPTVAAVGGLAFGGGFEISLSCDFRIANEKAKFGLTEIVLGLIPGGGGTYRLPKLIGVAKAKELMLLGEVLKVEDAERLNLVTKIVPVGALYEEAFAFAKRLSNMAPVSVALIKEVINTGYGQPRDTALEIESRSFSTLFSSEDAKEGMRAFLEKRAPIFGGK